MDYICRARWWADGFVQGVQGPRADVLCIAVLFTCLIHAVAGHCNVGLAEMLIYTLKMKL